jgi:DNA-directed RNA polymerase subunit RPC12/RpoP
MQTQVLSCASCGATISVPPDLDRINCAHCGAALNVVRGDGYVAS